jgi:hypothetical protein
MFPAGPGACGADPAFACSFRRLVSGVARIVVSDQGAAAEAARQASRKAWGHARVDGSGRGPACGQLAAITCELAADAAVVGGSGRSPGGLTLR